ncbi:hypothetical protein OsI_08670 [Oryza sativa Indica Group]|uniref:Uncharacterized protein n=1 Tax=Oryza sativa subsp. indica TaxID=39946 RepID=B8AHQ0_ORYSI|nr:hypothetical protein OsI_08670 [Oryza sativa Indica Group]
MAAVEGEVESLTTRVAELTTSLNSILGSLQGMEKWIPAVDEGIKDLRQAVEQVASRVTTLEAKAPATTTPVTIPPDGHSAALNHQGAATGTPVDQGRALVKGKLQFHNSPVHFDLGDCSEKGMGGLQSPGRFLSCSLDVQQVKQGNFSSDALDINMSSCQLFLVERLYLTFNSRRREAICIRELQNLLNFWAMVHSCSRTKLADAGFAGQSSERHLQVRTPDESYLER